MGVFSFVAATSESLRWQAGPLVADDALEGFGDVIVGGLGPGRWRGLQVADAGGGEEAFVFDAFGMLDVVEPVGDVVVDLGTSPAAG